MERLKLLEDNLLQLQRLKAHSQESPGFFGEKHNEWALRYGLLESIQIIIDVSCEIVTKHNLGNPKSSRECIEILRNAEYISVSLEKTLSQMVGLRNLLSHEYVKIDLKQFTNLTN